MDMIATTYESANAINPHSLKNGTVCIAKYAQDKMWYRAVVESVSADKALVLFCDYGDKEYVPLADIKEIKNEHTNLPAQGIPCSLLAAKPQDLSWSAGEIERFIGTTEGRTLEATFVSQNKGRFDVILKVAGSNININLLFGATPEQLKSKIALRKFSAPAQVQEIIEMNEQFSCQSFSPDAVEHVSIIDFSDLGHFFCKLKSSEAALNEMMTSIQKAYYSKSPTNHPFQVGLPVIAKYGADNSFYRAEVKEILDPVSVLVQYVDYGNYEKTMNSCVWDMEARFMNLPKQAVLCTLRGVKPVNEKWSQSDIAKYFVGEDFTFTFHRFIEEKFEVSIVYKGMDVATCLIEADLARKEITETVGDLISDKKPMM